MSIQVRLITPDKIVWDTNAEEIILPSVTGQIGVLKNHATLIIAHRLSTIIEADEIIVLANGTIAESGKHLQLLKEKGIYWEMWEKQQKSGPNPLIESELV